MTYYSINQLNSLLFFYFPSLATRMSSWFASHSSAPPPSRMSVPRWGRPVVCYCWCHSNVNVCFHTQTLCLKTTACTCSGAQLTQTLPLWCLTPPLAVVLSLSHQFYWKVSSSFCPTDPLPPLPSLVVPWGQTPLPQHSHHPGGHQAGPSRWQGHYWEAEGEETHPHHLPSRPGHGQRNQSVLTLLFLEFQYLAHVTWSKSDFPWLLDLHKT